MAFGLLAGGVAGGAAPVMLPHLLDLDPVRAGVAIGLGLAAAACGLRRRRSPRGDLSSPRVWHFGEEWDGREGLRERLSKGGMGDLPKAVRRELRKGLEPRRPDDPIVALLLDVLAFHWSRRRVSGRGRDRRSEDVHDVLRDLAAAMAKEGAPEAKARAFRAAFLDRLGDGGLRDAAGMGGGLEDHAMRQTVVMEALHRARSRGGHIAATQFRWLKRCDPTLWDAVDGVGGFACRPESLGARLHWQAELAAGRALAEPQVEGGVAPVLRLLAPSAARGLP